MTYLLFCEFVYVERSRRHTSNGLLFDPTVCARAALEDVLIKCNPDTWEWNCKFFDGISVYYYKCNIVKKGKPAMDCKQIKHRHDTFVCCNPSCPKQEKKLKSIKSRVVYLCLCMYSNTFTVSTFLSALVGSHKPVFD